MELKATRGEWIHYSNSDIRRDLDNEADAIIELHRAALEKPDSTHDEDMYNKGYIAAVRRMKQLPVMILKEEFDYGTDQ